MRSSLQNLKAALPFGALSHFKDTLHPQGQKDELWFIFFKDQLLVSSEKKAVPNKSTFPLKKNLFIGVFENKHVYACEVEEHSPPSGWAFYPLRSLFETLSNDIFSLAGRAMSLLKWDSAHQYCGYCGQKTFPKENERCLECLACHHHFYPNQAPAIMALIKKENQILLARGILFPEEFYSVIAGFVDPGETLEQCVAREVFEEVGIDVENICYFASQPWPFSNSLMIGFTCTWKNGEIKIDPKEIIDARWFDATNLPNLPSPCSLSRILINSYENNP